MAEHAGKPKVRFAGFTEDWEQRKLGELTNISSASRVHKGEWTESGVPFFRSSDVVSAFKGEENEKAFISYSLYEGLAKKSGKVQEGDVLITGGGSIGIPYLVKNNEPLYFKDADLLWLKQSRNLVGNFLYTFFTAPVFSAYVQSISHIGTIAHYTIEQIKDTPILFPKVDEQQKIGTFFRHLDHLITLHQRKRGRLENIKKAMLEKMFPKNGADVPEVRFAGFTEAWEQRKLGDLAEFNPKAELPTNFEYVDLESVVGTELINHRTQTKCTAPSRAQRLAQYGDLFYQLVRPYQKNNYLFELNSENFVFSTGYAQLRPSVDGYFLMSLVQNEYFVQKVLDNCTGTSYPAINVNDLAEINIYTSLKKSEQARIGTFFRQLDRLVTLHQRKVALLQNIKKACLEKMFV